MARKRKGRYPNEFRRMAVERLKRCENIVALSEELGVHRRLLYKWRDQLDPVDIGDEPPPENPRESTLPWLEGVFFAPPRSTCAEGLGAPDELWLASVLPFVCSQARFGLEPFFEGDH